MATNATISWAQRAQASREGSIQEKTQTYTQLLSEPVAATTTTLKNMYANEAEESKKETHMPHRRSDGPTYTLEEVSKHRSQKDAWIAVKGKVYDITPFIAEHWGHIAGGSVSTLFAILRNLGTDATEEFTALPHSKFAWKKMEELYIGELAPYTQEDVEKCRLFQSSSVGSLHSMQSVNLLHSDVKYSLPDAETYPMPSSQIEISRKSSMESLYSLSGEQTVAHENAEELATAKTPGRPARVGTTGARTIQTLGVVSVSLIGVVGLSVVLKTNRQRKGRV